MTELKTIRKKDIFNLYSDSTIWDHPFLVISKNRLFAHSHNPNLKDDDIVLLLAYLNEELVGYMGIFIDKITIDNKDEKIGWLSTWWVHPKTKGQGVGRTILEKMYMQMEGKIGISQFTESAKRVYDKSGYFVDLKETEGIKAVMRSNLSFLFSHFFPERVKYFLPILALVDKFLNVFVDLKLGIQNIFITAQLRSVTLEYLNHIDNEALELINKYNRKDLSKKGTDFFNWLKSNYWVEEAPLLELTNKNNYEFSMYDKSFKIYFIKINFKGENIGFLVLQKRNVTLKILFAYYEKEKYSGIVTSVIKSQCIKQNVREIINYDLGITSELKKSKIFIYKRRKIKNSIISKAFGKKSFEEYNFNFGDGDCSFA